jgi:hypothetical protein
VRRCGRGIDASNFGLACYSPAGIGTFYRQKEVPLRAHPQEWEKNNSGNRRLGDPLEESRDELSRS